MREWLTKRRNIIIIGIVISIVVLVVVIYNTYPIIYGKLYSGNHINFDLSISYEGKKLDINDYRIECINPDGNKESIVKDGEMYAIKGGKYGKYYFIVTIDADKIDSKITKEDIIIEMQYLNTNDWYISNSKGNLEITSIDDSLYCSCKINTKYNDGSYIDYSKEEQIENHKAQFSWGN